MASTGKMYLCTDCKAQTEVNYSTVHDLKLLRSGHCEPRFVREITADGDQKDEKLLSDTAKHSVSHPLVLYRRLLSSLPTTSSPDNGPVTASLVISPLQEQLASLEARIEERLNDRFSSLESRLGRLEDVLGRIAMALDSAGVKVTSVEPQSQ